MTLATQILLASLPLLINLYADRWREADKLEAFPDDPEDLNLPLEQEFDFIIIGGGTAGSVLARRLSDSQKFSVLLLEGGGDPPPLQAIKRVRNSTLDVPAINYLWQSVPQKFLAGRVLPSSGGKMIGGASAHNEMQYERGHPRDFQRWAQLTGDDSLLYENVLPFFLKAEDYRGGFPKEDQHAVGGPMGVKRPIFGPGRDVWLEAGKELGFNITDPNGPQTVGFSPLEYNLDDKGRALNSYKAYIKPILKKPENRLTIHRYSFVTQILIENRVARGVLYERHGIPRVARARKEVILSAGVMLSPIILIKSGIGPQDQLDLLRVPKVVNLPVGHNLQDGVCLDLTPIYIEDPSKHWDMDKDLQLEDFTRFLKDGEGPLNVGVAQAHIASSRARIQEHQPDWPDLQLEYLAEPRWSEEPENNGIPEPWKEASSTKENQATALVFLNRPYSSGRVTVNASAVGMDDNFLPIIDHNYLSNSTDLDVVFEGIEFVLKVIENTTAFQQIGARFGDLPIPECAHETFRTRDYWKCYVQHRATAGYHFCCTNRMGRANDTGSAVVDSNFRVIGVGGLRVVDASSFPAPTNSNSAAVVIMMAERAAALVLQQYEAPAAS